MKKFDVIVVGGGPSGICAAIAAGRKGMKTVLLERHPYLGGMGTAALVNNFCNAHHDGERFIIGGIFAEIRDALIERDALFVTGGLEPFNHGVFKEVAETFCREANVEVITDFSLTGIDFPAEDHVVVKRDGEELHGRAIVDASGDAFVAAAAGVRFLPRAEGRRLPMPLTYCYLFGPVDMEQLKEAMPETIGVDQRNGQEYLYLGSQARLKEYVSTARLAGELTIPRDRIAVAYSVPGTPEVLSVNFGRVVIEDPTDAAQMQAAEEVGLQQIKEGEAFFRKYVPGCDAGGVIEVARQIGVRESRQIDGLYCLSGKDVLEYRQFDDVIAQCRYSIDVHEPESDTTTMVPIPQGKHYDIPFRSLVPVTGPPNLIVAGRSISATQEAMSSFRVSPSVMAIGQAAGTAAALAVKHKCPMKEVNVKELQKALVDQGAILT